MQHFAARKSASGSRCAAPLFSNQFEISSGRELISCRQAHYMVEACLHSHCEDDSLPARTLRRLQRDSFEYFVREVNPANGLVLDKTAPDWPASIAAMGMALSVYPVGVERGFTERAEAARRTLTMLNVLAASEQS